MGAVDCIRRLLRRSDVDRFGAEVFNHIVACSKTPEQQEKVLCTIYHLTRLWKDGDSAHIPKVIAMVEETHPHLERMADLEVHSTKWLVELAAATQITADSADDTVQQSEQFDQLLLLIELMKKYPMANRDSSKATNSPEDLPVFPFQSHIAQ